MRAHNHMHASIFIHKTTISHQHIAHIHTLACPQWRKNKGPKGEPLWNKVTPKL